MIRTGWYFASVPAVAAVAAFWGGWWLPGTGLFLVAAFVLFFFRDPEREVPAMPGAVVSPADGRVLAVEAVSLDARPHTKVSIFLSLLDVHVNRAPIAGRITAVAYRPGRFHIASRAVASRENEQNEVTLEGEETRVVFKQIAGLLARRIEFWAKPGDRLERGQRVGLIRFGSRVEVFFEAAYRARVKPGDHVRGGASILATRE